MFAQILQRRWINTWRNPTNRTGHFHERYFTQLPLLKPCSQLIGEMEWTQHIPLHRTHWLWNSIWLHRTWTTARVHEDNQVSEEIQIVCGEKQGDPVSSKLSTAIVNEVFVSARPEQTGITVDGKRLSEPRFTDDVTLATEDVKDVEYQVDTVNEESLTVGLWIYTRTQLMTSIDTTGNIQKGGTETETVFISGINNRNGKVW